MTNCRHKFKLNLIAAACLGVLTAPVHADRLVGLPQGAPSPVVDADEDGFGAWNLDNVNVRIVDVDSGLDVGKTFNEGDGSYDPMVVGDTFVSEVSDDTAVIMGNLHGKDWPVGEPSGVKAITAAVNNEFDKPESCIMSTSYYSTDDGATGWLDDPVSPNPTLCDSPFQTHKRFKVDALPASVDGVDEETIDLVFNVEDEVDPIADPSRRYMILQKLNNYTDKRLSGYKIELGFGVGSAFVKAVGEDIALSLGLGEGVDDLDVADGSDIWDPVDLAVFSAGLFGKADDKHPNDGFFDDVRAGYNVELTDAYTIESTTPFAPSNYTLLFGDWLPSIWEPTAIFFDEDNNPLTDAKLVAFWGDDPSTVDVDYQWLLGNADGFAPVPEADLIAWATDTSGTDGTNLYSVGGIEDVLNLGLTYIVNVGDVFDVGNVIGAGHTNFTIRMTPIPAVDQTVPGWVTTTPTPLEDYIPDPVVPVVPVASSGGGGGGCVANPNNAAFDPVLPAILLSALGYLGFRRRQSGNNNS